MSDSAHPPIPVPDPDSTGFWESLARGSLTFCRCTACRRWLQPPLEVCRHCAAPTSFEPVSGRGRVFSFIMVRHQTVPGLTPPYAVALVELEEQAGLRINGLVEGELEKIEIGTPVRAVLREIGRSGIRAPSFELFT